MPGNLLPHEVLTGLTDVAGRIVDEVLASEHADGLAGSSAGPALYLVEHSIDATVLGLRDRSQARARGFLQELGTGLFLQDIGKLALPPSLVHHPGPLAPDEWELMMQHPLLGLQFLRDDTISAPAKSVVRSHHERWNGSGYPSGLVGEEISLVRAHRRRDRRLLRRHERALPRERAAAPRGSRAGPRRVGQRLRSDRRRGLPRRRRELVAQVERGADDGLGVDLVMAVDVVEIA